LRGALLALSREPPVNLDAVLEQFAELPLALEALAASFSSSLTAICSRWLSPLGGELSVDLETTVEQFAELALALQSLGAFFRSPLPALAHRRLPL